MGLNPPFGLNAHLANKFIDKALTFKPKLLILIVPEETRRLDLKSPHYDLIWEDRTSLSGKSFYLPGSIDVNDKQIEQWNVRPPVLYLWSRPDWTTKHMGIASSQGHKSKMQSSLLGRRDPQPYSEEDTALADKNTEEKYKERDANQGEKESMPLKEAASAVEAQVQVERREEASGQKETRREKKNIHEGFENKESAAARKELGRGVHGKNKEAIPEKKSAVPGKKDGRPAAGKHNKKRKSPESHKDGTQKMKMVKKELQQQEQQEEDGGDLPNMSISPPPRGEPIDLPPIQTSLLGSGLRNISSAARPSGIHEDLDTFPRRFSSVERESFYTPGTEVYGRYNSPDTYSPSKYARIGYGRPDPDLRMQSRPYSMQEEEVPNSYGRPAESDFRAQLRTYGVPGEENHSDGIRFSVGGSGPSLGQIGIYPSSSYRFTATATETSAMQRYAPRLDEMNHSRPHHLSPAMPFPGRDVQGLRRENPPDSFGFAPETSPFSNRGSFGWIDD